MSRSQIVCALTTVTYLRQFEVCKCCSSKRDPASDHLSVTVFEFEKRSDNEKHQYEPLLSAFCSLLPIGTILHFSVCLHVSTQPLRQTPLQALQTVAYDNSEICSHISREVKLWRAWASRAYVWLRLCCYSENTLRSYVQDVLSYHHALTGSCCLEFLLSYVLMDLIFTLAVWSCMFLDSYHDWVILMPILWNVVTECDILFFLLLLHFQIFVTVVFAPFLLY